MSQPPDPTYALVDDLIDPDPLILAAHLGMPEAAAAMTASGSGHAAVPLDGGVRMVMGTADTQHRICRYTTDLPTPENEETSAAVAVELDTYAQYTLNAEHPRKYCLERARITRETPVAAFPCTGRRVRVNLINQNFLVISSGDRPTGFVGAATAYSCPSPTVAHQPST